MVDRHAGVSGGSGSHVRHLSTPALSSRYGCSQLDLVVGLRIHLGGPLLVVNDRCCRPGWYKPVQAADLELEQ